MLVVFLKCLNLDNSFVPFQLTAKNIQCMRAILSVAHCHGGILGSAWHVVLTTLQVYSSRKNEKRKERKKEIVSLYIRHVLIRYLIQTLYPYRQFWQMPGVACDSILQNTFSRFYWSKIKKMSLFLSLAISSVIYGYHAQLIFTHLSYHNRSDMCVVKMSF